MLQRKNIYLVYKEAMNNAVKYSGSGSIAICFFKKDSTLHLSITDNGKGFDIASVNGNGNGLINMKRRATEINGNLSIKTASKKGNIRYAEGKNHLIW